MKRALFRSCIFWAFSSLAFAGELNDTNQAEITEHPSWILHKNNISEDQKTLTLVGTLPATNKKQLTFWRKNVQRAPCFEKLETIFLNYGHFKEEDIAYLSEFKNVRNLTLGISIEGILIAPEALQHTRSFKKLTSLNIAIHGLSNKHLNSIGDLKNLEALSIQFPSVHMVVANEMKLWGKTELCDKSIKELSELHSLKFLVIVGSPQTGEGEVKLTIGTINSLLLLPNLKKIHIDAANFTDDALKIIKHHKLPDYVKIK